MHNDDAPTVYIKGNPGQTDAVTRSLERNFAALQAYDPIPGSNVPLMQRMAGLTEMQLLHMVTSDPARTPTFTYFADADFYLSASSHAAACTWLGLAGPGVRRIGETGEPFSDHTDIRPTVLSLAGLKDDYTHDGRVLFEVLHEHALPRAAREHAHTLRELAEAYKQINAPLGKLGRKTLEISTQGLAGDDATYAAVDSRLAGVLAQRNAIAAQMIGMLEGAAFGGQAIDEEKARRLIDQARELLESVE